jgi:hypothetical protein
MHHPATVETRILKQHLRFPTEQLHKCLKQEKRWKVSANKKHRRYKEKSNENFGSEK